MTIYYSKSANGFFDSEVNPSIVPSDAKEISAQIRNDLLAVLATGKVLASDKSGLPIAVDPTYTNDQIIAQYNNAAQVNLDKVAKSWGYDSLVSAASYSGSSNPQFKAEAEALINWRDNYWSEAYTIEAGTLPATSDAFLALLPAAPTKPVI